MATCLCIRKSEYFSETTITIVACTARNLSPLPGHPCRVRMALLARRVLKEVAWVFLKLGLTAFGGPAAAVALMHNEIVTRRKWISEQSFLDLFAAANLLPGPTSTELAIFLGVQRAGWIGLLLGGVCFIFPAMLIVLVLAWLYTHFGTTPAAEGLFYGIKPVVIGIILLALWLLGRRALTTKDHRVDWMEAAVAVLVAGLYLAGVNVLLLLLVAGLGVMLVRNFHRLRQVESASFFLPLASLGLPAAAPASLTLLFLTFLKIGAVLFGGGYVLLAFLRADLVTHLGWLTDRQLLDAVAVGQFTPGPLFTTATFIGYLVGGIPGPCWPPWVFSYLLLFLLLPAAGSSQPCAPHPGYQLAGWRYGGFIGVDGRGNLAAGDQRPGGPADRDTIAGQSGRAIPHQSQPNLADCGGAAAGLLHLWISAGH